MSNPPSWIETTTYIAQPEFAFYFLLRPSLFIGNPNDPKQVGNRDKFSVPLYVPLNDPHLFMTTQTALTHFDELVRYYENVIHVSAAHKCKLMPHYFWVRPLLLDKTNNQTLVGFPWYDTVGELDYLCTQLQKNEEGSCFNDADQGWSLEIAHYNNKLFVQESDPDEGEVYCLASMDRAPLLEQVTLVQQQAHQLVKRLSQHFARDYWTRYWNY